MTECSSPKISDNSKLFTFATSSQHFTGGSSQGIRQEKEINPIQIGKHEIKLPLFADWYDPEHKKTLRNPKEKWLKLIKQLNKVVGTEPRRIGERKLDWNVFEEIMGKNF